jgi:hypothetical protein
VVVAVIDSGINYNHEDLAANMWRNPGEIPGNGIDDDGNGYVDDVYGIDTADDFYGNDSDPIDPQVDTLSHGTACASVIGAVGNNGRGIAGVKWSVQLMALRNGTTNNLNLIADTIAAFEYIILMKSRGVNIRATSNSYYTDPFGVFSQALRDSINAAGNEGILNVFAAGNNAADTDVSPFYPATYDSPARISVAASDASDNLASFSNFGRTNVDLAAPGVGILMASGPATNAYTSANGTFFSCPLVAGAAALLFAAYPDATAEDVKAALLETVDVLPAFTNKMVSNGRLNVGRAVTHPRLIAGPPVVITQPQLQTVVLSNSATFRVTGGGTRPLHYQWLFNSAELADATNAVLNLGSVPFSYAGEYHVVVTNALGSVTSQVATLTVVPLFITSHPRSQNIRPTSNVMFSVSISSSVPVHYQWRLNDTNLVGTDSATFGLPNVQLSNEGNYSVEVSNLFGTALSSNAALVVRVDPLITIAPVSQSVVAGGSATFSVAFTGNPIPFGVEWRQGSVPKASNTVWRLSDFFTLTNAHPINGGTWRVIVRNLARNVTAGENRTFNLTLVADTDGDGLPDAWETAYPTAVNSAEDTELDGLTNLQEYQAGTDPENNQSHLRVESLALAGGANAVSLRFVAAANKTYTVEARDAVDSGTWTRVADAVAVASDRVIELIDAGATGHPTRYYRLVTPRIP